MIIRYVNNFGELVNLNEYPYKMLISDIFDYDHEIISNENKIIGFTSEFISDRTVSVDVHRTKEKTAFQLVNALTDIFQKDILAGVPGRLYIDSWYLRCFFKGREMNRWDTAVIISLEYEVCFEKMAWIKEVSYYAPPVDIDGLLEINTVPASLENPHYTECDFLLKAYGPFDELFFYVNDNQYRIVTSCKDGEYLLLDTRDETIVKVDSSGNKTNAYASQVFTLDNFKKIPAGSNSIRYKRNYAIEITLFQERSEPKWNEAIPNTHFLIMTEDNHPILTEDGYYLIGEEMVGGAI